MPSYAILGATGNCGRSLLQILSQDPTASVHAYVRSGAKLRSQNRSLGIDDTNLSIYEGSISDTAVIRSCITGTRAVFLAIALSHNQPECTVAQETARSVVAALKEIRAQDPLAKLPRVIVLSSATIDDHLSRHVPRLVRWLLLTCSSYVYADLVEAEKYLRAHGDWLSTTFMKPGGLAQDVQRGHELSTERDHTFISYLDLAAGMVEVADAEGEKWDMANVSVVPAGGNRGAGFEWMAPVNLVKGLLCHFFPWTTAYMA